MRTPKEIQAEIATLKALKPVGKFIAKTQNSIRWMIEELESGVDDTANEWNEMTDFEQDTVMQTRRWKEGDIEDKPSDGWGTLVG